MKHFHRMEFIMSSKIERHITNSSAARLNFSDYTALIFYVIIYE